VAQAVGLGLEHPVPHHGDPGPEGIPHPPHSLLDDVGKLVAEETLTLGSRGIVLAWSEIDVRALGESHGTDRWSLRADVNPDVREARFEEGFHLLQDRRRQGLARPGSEITLAGGQLPSLAMGHALNRFRTLLAARRRPYNRLDMSRGRYRSDIDPRGLSLRGWGLKPATKKSLNDL